MGIIQRQGLKHSIVQYVGVGIGMLSTLLVYPLATEAYGLIQFLKSTALLVLPLANWGIQTLTVRFFPQFRTEDGAHHGFLTFLLTLASLAFLVFALLIFLFWDPIHSYYQAREATSPVLPLYLAYFIPLTYLLILVNLLTAYISNFKRIVVPSVAHDLFLKIALPILILLHIGGYLPLPWLVRTFLLVYVVIILMLLGYLYRLGELRLRRPAKQIWQSGRAMIDYAGFNMLGSLGGVVALQLDVFMLGSLDSLRNTGIYSLALTIATVISIPQRSILNISAPIIADSWHRQDKAHLQKLYGQTSLMLLLAGLWLLIEISINLPDLCALLGVNGDIILEGYWVIVLLGIGRVVDMGTSINGLIIQYSDYYRTNVYFILLLSVINIGLNLWLIPRYGITGAAMATAASLITYNILRTSYVYWRFGMHPFSRATVLLLLIAALSSTLGLIAPDTPWPLLNLFYRAALIAVVFLGLAYWWKVSVEFNDLVDRWLSRLLQRGRK